MSRANQLKKVLEKRGYFNTCLVKEIEQIYNEPPISFLESEKAALIAHLKTKPTNTVQALWAAAKDYYNDDAMYIMGGSYFSYNYYIKVTLKIHETIIKFHVSIKECEA